MAAAAASAVSVSSKRRRPDVTPAEQAMLDHAYHNTIVRVSLAISVLDEYYFIGKGWITFSVGDKWHDFPLEPGPLDAFLTTIRDYSDYHLHIIVPKAFRHDPVTEPPPGWSWVLDRPESAGPPPAPLDDVHVMTVQKAVNMYSGRRMFVRRTPTVAGVVDEIDITLPQIRSILRQAVADIILPISRRRALALAVLKEQTQLPPDMMNDALVPFIDYRRRRRRRRLSVVGHFSSS